tara:strand:- start:148889 stop:149683 length:795 start_codon:yes stop_codon:yes gene_type:complete
MVNQAVKMKTMEDNPHIAIVSINRPENYNSITVEVLEELIAAAEKIAEDTSIRAVVLTGEGGYFSSGADFSLFASAMGERDTNQARIIGRKGSRACQAWEDLPQPTIAAIEGGVVGGGLAVAMACDWRVMADNSYAYVPEVKVGVNFGWGSLPRLTNLVGGPKAKLMSILCHKHKADECADWGLADYVTDDCGAVDKALELAAEICELPRLPVQLIKRGVNVSANALAAASGYGDLEDLLLCVKDEEATKYRMETIQEIQNKRE